MSIIASENFDSYSNGDNLNGKSGGVGWSASWVATATTVYNAISGNSHKIAKETTNTGNYARLFPTPTTNKVKVTFYVLKDNSNTMMYMGFNTTSKLYTFVFDGSSWAEYRYNGTTAGGQTNPFPNTGQWYKCTIEVDKNITTNNVKFSVDDVVKATFSTTITEWANFQFWHACSGYGTGMSMTDIQIDDLSVNTNASLLLALI